MINGISATLIVICVLMAVITEMTGVVAVQIGAQRRYDGPMGKSDRAFVFGAIALVLGLGYSAQVWVNYILMIMIVLLCLTVVNRSRRALEEVR